MTPSHGPLLSKLFKLNTAWRHINFFCWSESIVRSKWSTEEQFPNGNFVRKWQRQKKRFNDHLHKGFNC